MLVMLGSVFLHLHPVKVPQIGNSHALHWCMGGITFFLFLVLDFTGLLLMFYYRATWNTPTSTLSICASRCSWNHREIHRWARMPW